jgi:hypothetical protein
MTPGETRTTGSESPFCARCAAPIRGRRRNGYCSDRCRMAERRQEESQRRQAVVSRLKEVVAAVEAELLRGGAVGAEDDR